MDGQITLFGDVSLSCGDLVVDRFETRKTALLFAILAAEPGRWHDRTVLADRIWPDDFADATLPRLRQALASLRRSLSDCSECIEADRVRVRLVAADWTSDYAQFQAQVAAKQGRWAEMTIPERPLLEGFAEPWASSLRQHTAGQVAWLKANMPVPGQVEHDTVAEVAAASLPPWKRGMPVMFGRGQERTELRRLLEGTPDCPLITVIGLGGIGKTSLVKTVMSDMSGHFGDRMVWIDLTRESQVTELATPAIQALSLASADSLRRLAERRPVLVAIDNAEHLIDATAGAVQALLEEFPGLKIVVTSRVALELSDERMFPLGPLEVPAREDFSDSLEIPSVALFMRAAQRVNPSITVDQNVLEICRRLEGIPLAIRLAAGRCQSLSPAELLRDLTQRLELLQTHLRDVPERQRKMTSVIEWSLDQLSPDTRELLEHLAEFSAPWTQALAAELMARPTVVNEIQELLSFALISREDQETQRFRVLMPIREFVRATRPEETTAAATKAHAELFLAKSAELGYGMHSLYPHYYDVVRAQVDEFWRAHLYWLDNDPIRSLQLANNVHYILAHSDGERFGRLMLEQSLELATDATDSDKALAYVGLANLHSLSSDAASARAAILKGREYAIRADNMVVLNDLLSIAGHIEMLYGDYERAEEFYREGIDVAKLRLNESEVIYNWGSVGYLYATAGHGGDGIGYLTDCLAEAIRQDATLWICNMYKGLAISHFAIGQTEMALSYTQEVRDLATTAGVHKALSWSHGFEALLLTANGHYAQAQTEVRAGSATARKIPDQKRTVDLVVVATVLLASTEGYEMAARLIGALDAFCDRYQMKIPGYLSDSFEQARATARERLGEAFHDAHITGAFEGYTAALRNVAGIDIGVRPVVVGRRV